MAEDKSILDFTEITDALDTDILYVLRGTGADRDKKIQKSNLVRAVTQRSVITEDDLSARDVVVTNFDMTKYGKASTSWDPKIGTPVELYTGGSQVVRNRSKFLKIDETRTLAVFADSLVTELVALVISVSADGVVTMGTAVQIYNAQVDLVEIVQVDTDKFVVAYSPTSGSLLYAKAFTVTGTTVGTPGTAATIYGSALARDDAPVAKLTTNVFAIMFVPTAPTQDAVKAVWSVSGTTISQVGSNFSTTVNGVTLTPCMCRIGEELVLLTWVDSGILDRITVTLFYVNATTGVWGNVNTMTLLSTDGATTNLYTRFLLSAGDGHAILVWEDRSIDSVGRVVGFSVTYDGIGSDSKGAFELLWENTIQRADLLNLFNGSFNMVGDDYVPVVRGKITPGVLMYNNKKGFMGLNRPQQKVFANSFSGVTLADKRRGIFYYSDVVAAQTDRDVVAIEMFPKVIGFATDTATASSEVNVQFGGILDGFSGLKPNVDYYLQDDGTISTDATRGLVKVGTALSTTELMIDIVEPW